MCIPVRTSLPALSLIAALMLPPALVQAEPTRIDFQGHVTFVSAAGYPGVALGAPVSGYVVYESSARGQKTFSTPPYGFSFDYAGTVVAGPVLSQVVANDFCFNISADCVRFGEAGHTLNFLDLSMTRLSNDTMPGADVLRSFPIISLSDNVGGTLRFNATVDALTITAVPEPEAWALMLAGLGIVGRAWRRRSPARTGGPA